MLQPKPAVGILGGSFNPPHAGHLHMSVRALRDLDLDAVWWLVSPANPLKDSRVLESFETRVMWAHRIADHERIHVVNHVTVGDVVPTACTLAAMREIHPEIAFLWMMGADNLAIFHRWRHWREIIDHMPIAVFDRPDHRDAALSSPAARAYRDSYLDMSLARGLAFRMPPVWTFLTGSLVSLSSTTLRGQRNAGACWKRG